MFRLSSFMLSTIPPPRILTDTTTKIFQQFPCKNFSSTYVRQPPNKFHYPMSSPKSATLSLQEEVEESEKQPKLKWSDIGPDITEAQKQAISQLPPKMTKRCKALMRRIICFSPQDENLPLLLAAWVKVMKPRRADWLSVLKEMKRMENPLFMEVMEYALLDDSFEANVRDYTKLIGTYAKHNLLQNAENSFQAMKNRGFACDQVTLTVLVHMYSKARDLNRAREAFEYIKLLGIPLDKRAYGSMIMAYIRAGMLEHAESLVKEMEALEIFAGREVYKALLRAYSIAGNADGAQRVFETIQSARIVPDSKLCALLVNAYCVAGLSEKARSVLENMRSAGLKPSDKCVALMLGAYEKENILDRALGFLMEMEGDGVVLGPEASQVMAGWFHKLGVMDEVEHLLREFSEQEGKQKLHSL
ncbi:pentatricopeptide repeat-containing protein At1g01970-like [Phoenix dactylifera]|uniref:Pentatricopeptide repeat-containing protein At1g01970-like n=1 Tax=Phoenix dactylifera TaxID=42345 RepID=A0A8B8ZU62_PHODC|nr:pentatricopeptide repeat-containing protein At1g01970-like [Phoenix dactylifera]